MRGKQGGHAAPVNARGLIPTYAGKTILRTHRPQHKWAHPHVCGENAEFWLTDLDGWGSSPRMRGKQVDFEALTGDYGLIPTYAGKTARASKSIVTSRAHPHVCGENALWGYPSRVSTGSSPRMRGKHPADELKNKIHGLIPTYAGKTVVC